VATVDVKEVGHGRIKPIFEQMAKDGKIRERDLPNLFSKFNMELS